MLRSAILGTLAFLMLLLVGHALVTVLGMWLLGSMAPKPVTPAPVSPSQQSRPSVPAPAAVVAQPATTLSEGDFEVGRQATGMAMVYFGWTKTRAEQFMAEHIVCQGRLTVTPHARETCNIKYLLRDGVREPTSPVVVRELGNNASIAVYWLGGPLPRPETLESRANAIIDAYLNAGSPRIW